MLLWSKATPTSTVTTAWPSIAARRTTATPASSSVHSVPACTGRSPMTATTSPSPPGTTSPAVRQPSRSPSSAATTPPPSILLRNRKIDRPTPRLVRERLLPIATTVGEHELGRPVCSKTKRVAEVAAELYAGDRWSPKVHGFCTDQGRRDAVMGVMIIMLRKAGKGEGRARPREGDEGVAEETTGNEQQPPQQQQRQYEQVRGLPRWMHEVPDDVWWKVVEMVGIW